MRCPTCAKENLEDAAFCGQCGTALALICSKCEHRNPPDSAFCSSCGHPLKNRPAAAQPISYTPPHLAEKILRDRARVEGERRTVTILFADAVGSTSIGERVDEELLYGLMQGAFDKMMNAVHRYEGTVTQFRGDGIMALFGAPIAHEDSARRAVASALDMQEALAQYSEETERNHSVKFQFRVGLNTGPVVVGSIGDNLEMDYTAIGDTSNLAARMEQMADPGTVFLPENTYRAIHEYFDFESLGSKEVKGKSEPVHVYKVLKEKAVRTRLDAAAQRGLTPFVGRLHELSVLFGNHEQAERGHGQVVLISGDAGIGKSRTVREFRNSLGEGMLVLEGQCISYGRNIPYLPIIDLLKSAFSIEELDDEGTMIAKMDAATASWNPVSQKTVPYLKYLLNVDPGDGAVLEMDPFQRRARTLEALRNVVLEEAANTPVLIIIEDLHWVDERSAEALTALVDVIGTIPALLILTSRPGYVPMFGERTYFSRIALGSLPPEQSASMAQNVLGSRNLPEELENLITSKAEGNPFFVEEVTKSLVESGVLQKTGSDYRLTRPVEEISIPNTIQEVILSRIDRLEREAKGAIQLASVIGREFTVRLLQRISDVTTGLDHLLAELRGLELIYEKSYFPELSYMFKHALTHDVAYETLLLERRKVLHTVVANAIEELYSDRLPEHHETLAHHFYLGQQWEKALEYLILAGEKSQAAYANQDALRFLDRALEVAEHLAGATIETMQRILTAKINIYVTIAQGDEAVKTAHHLIRLAKEGGHRQIEGLGWGTLAFSELLAHRFDNVEKAAGTALAIADELDDGATRTGGVFAMAMLNALRGKIEIAWSQFDEVLQLSRENELPFYEVFAVQIPGLMHEWEGTFGSAPPFLEEATKLGASHHQTLQLLEAMWIQGLNLGAWGRYSQSLEKLHETLDLCLRMQDIFIQSRCLNTIGWVHSELYDPTAGLDFNRRGLDLALTMGDDEIIANARVNLADCYLYLGRYDDAQAELEDLYANLGEFHEWMKWRYSQHIAHSLGELRYLQGDAGMALALAGECLALAEPTRSRKNIVKGLRLKGQALAALSKHDEARAELLKALDLAEQVGNPPQLWKTLEALGNLLEIMNEEAEAESMYRGAFDVIESVAATLTDESLRSTFLGSPQVLAMRK